MSLSVAQSTTQNPFSSSRRDYPNYAAFSGLRWEGEIPVVKVEGDWFELVSISGVQASEIVAWCQENLGDKARERFREDLPVVLALMGHPTSSDVILELRKGGQLKRQKVTMTENNRRLLRGRSPKAELAPVAVIDGFQDVIESRFAYAQTNGAKWEDALAVLRENKPKSKDQLAFELGKIMALFIDGHAQVSGSDKLIREIPGRLPFLIEPVGERFIAFRPDRSGFLADSKPFITAIDGIPLELWLEKTAPFVAKGSPQYRSRHGLRMLRYLGFFRKQLALPSKRDVEVTFGDGSKLSVPVSSRKPVYGTWPRAESAVLEEGNLGYLRLESMNREAEDLIAEWMPKFQNTQGLIIDVRDNGGGSRKALLDLANWFAEKDDVPHVANVAAYRKWEGFSEDHLKARFMVRRDGAYETVKKFAKTFEPEWELPREEFSEWHYLLVGDSPVENPYLKPVIILQNAKCFSATDIFLAGLKGWKPNIRTMGTASAGGSARSVRHTLGDSEIELKCASMASFQPDGSLYDGNGVAPDIIVEQDPEAYLLGREDTQLEAAIRELLQ